MKISALVEKLLQVQEQEGDIEVTCTGSTWPDDPEPLPDIFETTVENLVVADRQPLGKRVRLFL
ncbi:MAG: hypothetical protein Q7K65_01455 [Candidatus Buchananbacteria bacterium]|nr:hypothetical protein [Candidatus Buchananbacteria bacterium]